MTTQAATRSARMINPVFVNEMRQSPLRRRWLVAVVIWGVVSSGLIWMTDFADAIAYQLSWLPMIVLPLIVPSFAAASFAKEYEQQTWQDLYLTRLTNWQVVTGKFWAALLQVWLVVLSFLPAVILMLGRDRAVSTLLGWTVLFSLELLLSASFYVLLAMVCSRYCSTRRGALVASYVSLFLYGFINLVLWSAVGEASARADWQTNGTGSSLPLPFQAGFMQSMHLIFSSVVGGGSMLLLWVSMSEQRGYRGGAELDARAWKPKP